MKKKRKKNAPKRKLIAIKVFGQVEVKRSMKVNLTCGAMATVIAAVRYNECAYPVQVKVTEQGTSIFPVGAVLWCATDEVSIHVKELTIPQISSAK